jgi:uncharacterized protein YbaR (Trm112 family)
VPRSAAPDRAEEAEVSAFLLTIIVPMAVDPELLEILACPNCKTKVELVKGGNALKCPQCRRVYPIKDDIPVMLIDEATIEN